MSPIPPKRKLTLSVIGLWSIFLITTIVMIALIIGNIFPPYDFWIPIIPIGILLILSIVATIVDFRAENRSKIGIAGTWTVFAITTVVMAALILGSVFQPNEYWIPLIPVGSLFVLAIVPTILEYASGEVKFCSKCGKKFEKKWEFCQECGMRVLMRCPSCGIKVKGNPKFCHKCGTNLSDIEVIQIYKPNMNYKVDEQKDFCYQCGAPANPEAKFCGYCGAPQK